MLFLQHWQGDYHFFDYKYNIEGYDGQDYDLMGSTYTWISIISIFIILVLLSIILKNKDKKTIVQNYLKILAIIMPILEITKVTWESYFDIKRGDGFNFCGLIPIYTCSLFIYCTILAAYSKGKVKDYCTSWLSTIGIVGGMSNVLFIQGLKWYPFFTFGAFYSMSFHYVMVFTGFLIPVLGYKHFEWKDALRAMIPHVLFSCIVIPIDYIFGWDYMQYYDAGGVPLIENLSDKFASFGARFLTIFVMMACYYALSFIFVGLFILGQKIADIVKEKIKNKKMEKVKEN